MKTFVHKQLGPQLGDYLRTATEGVQLDMEGGGMRASRCGRHRRAPRAWDSQQTRKVLPARQNTPPARTG